MKRWLRRIALIVPIGLLVVMLVLTASASVAPPQQTFPQMENQVAPAGNLNVRVYYLTATYQPGRHAIIKVWCDKYGQPLPEDNPDTAINVPYSVLAFDLKYNRATAYAVQNYERHIPGQPLVRLFFVNDAAQLCKEDGSVVTLAQNPNRATYALSQWYGMPYQDISTAIDQAVNNGATQDQVNAYIDSQVATINNLAQAKTVMANLMKQAIARDFQIIDIEKKLAYLEKALGKEADMEP